MNYKEYQDSELYSMICESSEEDKDILYNKYKYVIDLIIKKYLYTAKKYGIEYNDLYQEGLVGFADALNCYDDTKKVLLSSFIGLCVERRLQNAILKAGRLKNKFYSESLSLDHAYGEQQIPLKEMIRDQKNSDPLLGIENQEEYQELLKRIAAVLSKREYEVYEFMLQGLSYQDIALLLDKTPKQIDNAIQRIKHKVREVFEEVKLK